MAEIISKLWMSTSLASSTRAQNLKEETKEAKMKEKEEKETKLTQIFKSQNCTFTLYSTINEYTEMFVRATNAQTTHIHTQKK